MGNIQAGDKQNKTGKSPAKSKNFIKNLNRKSPGRESNKKIKKGEGKQHLNEKPLDKTPDSDNIEAFALSDNDATGNIFKTVDRECRAADASASSTRSEVGTAEAEAESASAQVTGPTCRPSLGARSTNREHTQQDCGDELERASASGSSSGGGGCDGAVTRARPHAEDNASHRTSADRVSDKSDSKRKNTPTKDSSSDSVFTDPLTPVAFSAEINQCYYSAESDSTLEELNSAVSINNAALTPSSLAAEVELNVSDLSDVLDRIKLEDFGINMPLHGIDDRHESPAAERSNKNDGKKEITENVEVTVDSCASKDDNKAMGSLLSSPRLSSRSRDVDVDTSAHECNHDFADNRLKTSPAQTSFTLSRHRKVELPPTKLKESCLVANDDSEKDHRRHSSVNDAPLESNVLRKVASLTLDQATSESKVTRPKFVPEKLDFQIYEKFEGQMLVNWFVSSVSEDNYLKSLVNQQDLRTLGIQYCTHLLAAGVLRQISDRDAPTDSIFRPDMMYYWAHTEAPTAQPVTPGRIQMLKWPPNFENAQKSRSLSDSVTNEQIHKDTEELCKLYDIKADGSDINVEEAKTIILQLKQQCEHLQIELEKYKTLSQIQTLTQNAQDDFATPPIKIERNSIFQEEKSLRNNISPTASSNEEPLKDKLTNKPVINIPELISDNIDVSSDSYKNDNSIIKIKNISEPNSRLNGNKSAGIRSDEVENFCKLNKSREQLSSKGEGEDVVAVVSDNVKKKEPDELKKLNGAQFAMSTDIRNVSIESPVIVSSKSDNSGLGTNSTSGKSSFDVTSIEVSKNELATDDALRHKLSHTDSSELDEITLNANEKINDVLISPQTLKDKQTSAAESSLSPPKESLIEISSVITTEIVSDVILPATPIVQDILPHSPGVMYLPAPQMSTVGPPPPPMPNLGPPPPPMPALGPPPPPMPVMGPPPPPMSGMGPPPSPMPGMGPPPPPMPGMGPPPPPMPGMGPPPPPMPGMGPPPPPMPGMGPPPPSMTGLGPPPPLMPGTGPPPPPMPGMGSSAAGAIPPPPMPGVSSHPVPPTGIGPPPPPMSGPIPFPAPPVGGWNMQRATLRKTPVVPSVPMKPLYWTRILAPQPSAPVQPEPALVKPLWVEIEETRLDNIDEFADLFSRQVITKKPAKKKVETKTKIQPIKILDSKRSQNVGILAQSLHVEFSEIENAIYNFDTSVVSLEALHQIYELRATDEELSMIKEHLKQKSEIPMDKPEAFLHDLSGIPNFAERISCFMFQAEFEDSICTIMHKLDNLKHTCEFLISNEDLKKLFAIILTLGNYMNGGNGQRGQADGFGLEILAKLRDVKSKESTVTLLHFIVRTYIRLCGGSLSGQCTLPVPEPGDVTRAAAIDFHDADEHLKQLAKQLQDCREKMKKVVETDEALHTQNELMDDSTKKRSVVFQEKMATFLEVADEKLKTENENLDECRSKFIATVKFYQYTPKTGKLEDCEPKEFFSLWLSFCTDFKDIFKKEEQFALKEKLKETKKRKEEFKATAQPKKEGGLKARMQKLAKK